jgi:hypothetical protein
VYTNRFAPIVSVATLVAAGMCFAPSLADAPVVPGHAIVARPEGDALVIWDATTEVTAIVKDKVADPAAKDRLERDALNELVVEESKLSNVTAVNIRVVYTKTGDVSPTYGSATFAGVERYATLTMTAADLKGDRDKWKETAAGTAALPAWVAFTISGELPPR